MNWIVFAAVAWLFLGLEQGLRDGLSLGSLGVAPSFIFCLIAFIAMTAPRAAVLWSAVIIGVAMDLLFRLPLRDGLGAVTIVGPHALAYAVACQLILALRGLMMRRNPLSLGFLAFVGSLVAYLMIDAIFTVRHAMGAPFAWEARRQLVMSAGSALYTGIIGIPLALVLFPLAGMLGLPDFKSRWSPSASRR